ncbi:MAG: peptide deformylase [Microbacteriaceae bacterium]
MAVLSICITGEPVLHIRAREVTVFDDDLRTLVTDMIDTMHEAPGVGLAAPQVGIDLRIFIYHWEDDDETVFSGVAINPELWISPPPAGEPDEVDDSEGCLSVPGGRFPLRRAELAILRAVDLDGTPFEISATGWLARIFQHEYDHLEGVLYVDRLDDKNARTARKDIKRAGWGIPGMSWMPGVDNLED